VKDRTEALLYVQAPHKVDLPGDFSYEFTWTPQWALAAELIVPERMTREERDWLKHVGPEVRGAGAVAADQRRKKNEMATLEWAKRIGDREIEVLEGRLKYNREAPKEDVEKLKLLKGHVKKGQFITKIRKVFNRNEMNDDLEFVRAQVFHKDDNTEYSSTLPTSFTVPGPAGVRD
jgi:hypothetical protein